MARAARAPPPLARPLGLRPEGCARGQAAPPSVTAVPGRTPAAGRAGDVGGSPAQPNDCSILKKEAARMLRSTLISPLLAVDFTFFGEMKVK